MRLILHLFIIGGIISCSSAKRTVVVPDNNPNPGTLIKVTGVKGKVLPRGERELKFDREYSGSLKDGWKINSNKYVQFPNDMFSEDGIKRIFLLNFGIGIADKISKTTDKFQFTIADSNNSNIVFCNQLYLDKSQNYEIRNLINYTKGERQISSFNATIMSLSDTNSLHWLIKLNYDRETPGGIFATTLRDGMPLEIGIITNNIDTIEIKPLFIKNATKTNNIQSMPFRIVGGYEFKFGENTIGWVDFINSTIGFAEIIKKNHKHIIAAASTAILLRNR